MTSIAVIVSGTLQTYRIEWVVRSILITLLLLEVTYAIFYSTIDSEDVLDFNFKKLHSFLASQRLLSDSSSITQFYCFISIISPSLVITSISLSFI